MAAETTEQPVEGTAAGLERPAGAGRRGVLERVRRAGVWPYLAALGPGLIAAAAGNDAGGIATYATVGAEYGYSLLWVMLVVTFLFILVQEMCARMGAVTGKGLSDLIREQFGLRWSAFATLILF